MELRRKLLVFFFGLIAVVLVVFGVNAYQIAQRAGIETEAAVLADLNAERSFELAKEYQEHPTLAYLSEHIEVPDHHDRVLLLIIDSHGKVLAASNRTLQKKLAINRINLESSDTAADPVRSIDVQGLTFTFAVRKIGDSPFFLVHLVQQGDAAQGALSRLATRIGISGLIIAWLAVWMALFISTSVARRINAETDKLEHLATHDGLTGLPNRVALIQSLENHIAIAGRAGKVLGLILMDLNRFREINDTLGHDTGDRVVQEMGERLRGALWEGDTVARVGGDDFALLMPIADPSHVRIVISKIETILAEPYEINGLLLHVDASLGVALHPEHADDAVTLLRRAEVAMYHAKRSRLPHAVYEREKDPYSVDRLKLMGDLRDAITRQQLFMVYQPKVDVQERICTGVEALIRWKHPDRGLVPPDQFIPLAEQTGAIKAITFWTLEESIRQASLWGKAGARVNVSVNLSAVMLQDPELPGRISDLLKASSLPASQLTLEITETAIMLDPDGALSILGVLDMLGVRLSIDDFGTGYTSLAYLKRLPVDEIKIDKSFILNILDDEDDSTIVKSIIDLAHNMQRRVVAEGVETEGVMARLAEQGCDLAQGYLVCRPAIASEFEEWVRKSSWPLERKVSRRKGGRLAPARHLRVARMRGAKHFHDKN